MSPSTKIRTIEWWVAGCLFISGAGSLTLEVVWSRLLRLVFGSTTLAISTTLVAYMLGLGLGAWLGGRWIARRRDGLRVYGWVEIGVGLYALALPSLIGLLPTLQREWIAELGFWPAAFVRFGTALTVLIVPTVLMGATLPFLVSVLRGPVETRARRVGWLYGVNTAGAVLGVAGATFILFPRLGLIGTNTAGAALDIAAGLAALTLWRYLRPRAELEVDETVAAGGTGAASAGRLPGLVAATCAIIGFTGLALEVAWARSLAMVFGSSVYAFSVLLAVFLAGIALGSLAARPWIDRVPRPDRALAFGLLALAATATIATHTIEGLPGFLADQFVSRGVSGATLVLGGVQGTLLALLPPTLILGALFPLAVRAAGGPAGDESRIVGRLYAANTVGSAAGAFLAGFVLIPQFGLHRTITGLIVLDLFAAALLFVLLPGRTRPALALAAASAVTALLVALFPPVHAAHELAEGVYYHPHLAIDFGIEVEPLLGMPEEQQLYYREGVNTTVSVHRTVDGIDLRLNGKTDASILDMSTQLLSGHLPLLFGGPARPDVLIVGLASGVTAGAVTLYDPRSVDVVELEPAVIEASHFFDSVNHRPLEHPAVRIHADDGRNFLARSDETYDIVISEPSNPWISGCSDLFTREYFAAVRSSLRPGGRLLQWIQLYGMDEGALTSVLAALGSEFDSVYGFLVDASDSDLLLLATDRALTANDLPQWSTLNETVRRDLRGIEIYSTADLWGMLHLVPAEIAALARNAPRVNTDDSMYVELRAPWLLYRPSALARQILQPQSGGALAIAAGTIDADAAASVALSHLWRRDDPIQAEAWLEYALRTGDGAVVRAVEAEWNARRNPPAPEALLLALGEAVAIDPDAFLPRMVRASRLATLRRWEAAIDDLDRALAARPDHDTARRWRLEAATILGRDEQALEDARKLIENRYATRDPAVWAYAATLEGRSGDPERGIAFMRTYLERNPNTPDQWRWLSTELTRLGRGEEAARAESNAQLADSNRARMAHRRALWYELTGETEQAREALEAAVQWQPEYEAARLDLLRLNGVGSP